MKILVTTAIVIATLAPFVTYAASGRLVGVSVTEVFVETRADTGRDGLLYGGCMVKLSTPASTVDPSCASDGFVTLACDGTFEDRSAAAKAFEVAQMAYVVDKPVNVWIEGNRRINGYCYASYVWAK